MLTTYMDRVIQQTPTRFWINNPSGEELRKAVEAGAINGTTNPAYGSKLLQREPQFIEPIIAAVIRDVEDDLEAADLVYQRITARFMEAFLPLYEQSHGTQGMVTMQDDPCRDHESRLIVEAALRHATVGANYLAKIPVMPTGMEAMAELIGRDIPICATECFSIAQTVAMCALYEEVSKETGKSPPFFITHITGIYDEELQAQVERDGIDIAPERLKLAGSIIARKQYRLVKESGYRTTLLGGGARGTHHFTEFVGGDFHITMNWSTIAELNEMDGEVVNRIDPEDPPDLVEELREKIPDFRRAYDDDGLTPDEFEPFAPLQRFRNNFIAGCEAVKQAIAERRR